MNSIKNYFTQKGFDFDTKLSKPSNNFLSCEDEETLALKKKLDGKVYFYKNNNQANTSFYLLTIPLEPNELSNVRKYIWNESKADLIFIPTQNTLNLLSKDEINLDLIYAKASPIVKIGDCIIDSFRSSDKDLERINAIHIWQFDSGAFWLNYFEKVQKIKQSSIDKELVGVLKSLQGQLNECLKSLENDADKRAKLVQALIDRTLYIKYLEDNHIINSAFYLHYFGNKEITYKTILDNALDREKNLNFLFQKIHQIFNNGLFDNPSIDDAYLNNDVCSLIFETLSGTNLNTGQLRLFDFQFNVIPVEFISYIYELFLTDKQKAGGIYYTPKKLAELIVDDVIPENKIGKVLDPSCGSGMFLIVAYQRLLENSPKKTFKTIEDEIAFRVKLLTENIFGIEKENTAQRFTIFSLSLQLLRDLHPEKLKLLIAKQLAENDAVDLFSSFDLLNNIIEANSLNIENPPFPNHTFDYIVGNPPFKSGKDISQEAIDFTEKKEIAYSDKIFKAKDIIDRYQISQCFLLKIKEWSKETTRFGFVSNSSNFYSSSKNFETFFYTEYNIEKIYELSKVKEILFAKATESVISIIFSNQINANNNIKYYPVEMGLLSEKPFQLLVIQEDKIIKLKQPDLISSQISLRDFLVGNKLDRLLISKVGENFNLKKFSYPIGMGFEVWGEDARKKEFNFSNDDWKQLNGSQKDYYLNAFINLYFRNKYSLEFNKSFIKPSNLKPFIIKSSTQFISSIVNFHRPRVNEEIYVGKKLIFTRIGSKLNCVYSQSEDYFDFSVYTFKLKNEKLYYLFQALLNSYAIQFYLDFYHRKRLFDSFPRIGNKDIEQIPIPKELDEELVRKITEISKDLTEGKYEYAEKEKELNELIFDLYDLSYLEKQRIRDYFVPKANVTNSKNELGVYKETLMDSIEMFLTQQIDVEFSNIHNNIIVAKIILNKNKRNSEATPSANKVALFTYNEIFEQNIKGNILVQEKIFGKDCIYIIKKNDARNWTETKAYEDGQYILKQLKYEQ